MLILLCRALPRCLTHALLAQFHAEIFGKDASYRADAMQLPPVPSADRPLVAQFCGNNPQLILKAARHVEHLVDAVDINLGCPQGIAKRGNYGSFLLEEYQLLHDIVSTLHQHLSIPVTCKIRRLKTDEATVALVRMLQEAGAALITIHGRTRHQLKDKVGACDFDIIRLVKQNCSVPVFANGGIYDLSDVQRCLAYTGVDGVMSSEALLCNPSIFSGKRVDSIDIAKESAPTRAHTRMLVADDAGSAENADARVMPAQQPALTASLSSFARSPLEIAAAQVHDYRSRDRVDRPNGAEHDSRSPVQDAVPALGLVPRPARQTCAL